MALVEVALRYRPNAVCGEGSVVIGGTDDPRVLRAVRDRLLDEAGEEARMWEAVDPGVAAIRTGELQGRTSLSAFLSPDEHRGRRRRRLGGAHGEPEEEAGRGGPIEAGGGAGLRPSGVGGKKNRRWGRRQKRREGDQ